MRRFARCAVALATLLPVHAAVAQTAPPPVDATEVRLHEDWPWLDRFRDANAALPTPDPRRPRIVFLGDSITQGWIDKMPAFFAATGRIDRGIGGQTTPQMLLRFEQDVVALRPAAVQIMAGTNDIAGNTGPMTPDQTQANIRAMADLARANGIRVILASIPPSAGFPWRPGLAVSGRIDTMNAWLRAYARSIGATYADYWSALHVGEGMRPAYTYDGVHPNEAGYAVMAPVALAAIGRALARPEPSGLRPR